MPTGAVVEAASGKARPQKKAKAASLKKSKPLKAANHSKRAAPRSKS
jgi:hypothetical protein